jgi:putative flavoprotein involved in K+ transport
MDITGLNDERYDAVENLTRARNVASFQLAGHADRRDIDLNALMSLGVRIVGRLAGLGDGKAQFSGSLRNVCELADLKLNRLLGTFDQWAATHDTPCSLAPPHRPAATRVEVAPPLALDFKRAGIRTIIWATGFRPDYAWLDIPVIDAKGALRHDGGVVTASPGLYAMGLPFLRRRKSSLIDGVGADAEELTEHLAAYVRGTRAANLHAQVANRSM